MKSRYSSITAWIEDARRIVRNDWDNVILFTGKEGKGKSTIMFQVMHALDADFTAERIHFTTDAFLEAAPETPRYGACALDEALVNKRKGMHGPTIRLLDYLQVCRGLNHHLALCFPHADLMDAAIMDHRIRYNIHVPQRGLFQLRVRVERRDRRGNAYHTWKVLGAWNFKENPKSNPLWAEYLAKKDAHMKRVEAAASGEKPHLFLNEKAALAIREEIRVAVAQQ